MDSVCVVGLGIIGSVWARHYAADGLAVRAWNRTPKPDLPGYTGDLRGAARGAAVVHLCVADPVAVQMVLADILPSLGPGQLVIQSSTISPAAAEGFADQVTATGAAYLEAPFTGSKLRAESRELVFFLGGEATAVAQGEPWLARLSTRRLPMGSPAQAAAIKLAMNLQIATIGQALAEGWHLAKSYGLSDDAFFGALRLNVAHSGMADLKEPKLRAGDFTPHFSVKHMAKDLGLALAAARDLNLGLTARTRELYLEGMERGWADLDFSVLEGLIADDGGD